ncbi:MAG: hypothetical protein JXR52_05660 [Bacteroidales bacterium]|nr:hypothetical protein [Bacteroidales bacterium]MBN2698293.1 hypothetical protein [Bacteroidales bacterium]
MSGKWKENWEESRKNYIDWWNGTGLVISMWEHMEKEGEPVENVLPPEPPTNIEHYWFNPGWRAKNIHYSLSKSVLKADIPPVANTHLGPGSLAAILGAELEGGEDTIWIRKPGNFDPEIKLNENNSYWLLHQELLKSCRKYAEDKYYVGMPDLVEGLDVLASLKGTDETLMDMILYPEKTAEQLQKINDIYLEVFNRLYDIIRVGDEMAFCYFSLWAPGKTTKIQSDISVMISEEDFRKFAQPYFREQCRNIEYTLYHLDGVDAIRHLDAILEIEELKAVQWTPGYGQPQGGDSGWYNLYKRIKSAGKSVMPCWVTVEEMEPLLDYVGPEGMNILMDFRSEKDVDRALEIRERYR